MSVSVCLFVLAAIRGPVANRPPAVPEDIADVASQDLRVGKDAHKRYFLVNPPRNTPAPQKGYGLVVVLAGGDGSAAFHPFVKRIYKRAVPDGYVLAQPVAVKWTEGQKLIWPTAKSPVDKMQFSTEEFIDAVIRDVGTRYQLDPEHVFTLTWSSGGPAAYAASLGSDRITGSFIAMSVFKPDFLPLLASARGQAYFLYHSPEDRLCRFRMAEQASKELTKNGATVKLATYDGGHGWRGNVYDDMRAGIEWLEKNHAKRAKR